MHKFLRTMTAAAVAAAMAPAFAADATYNVDVVVVGAGAAGTAAGWAAAEKGLKVVTLEKQAMVGGTGKFSEGIFAVESSMQRNWNYGLTKDEAFQKIMNYGHWRGNAKMVRAFVDKSGETIDWMQANGVKFEKLFSNYPNGLYTWHIYEGRGAGWINLFQQKYKDAGQTLLLNTWGKELIQDKNGTVKGVVATNKNGDKIRASILHDWQGDAESTFTKGGQTKRISEELGDTWLEYGVGANFNATKNLHLYADLEATEGAKVETSYRFNLGARWSF